MISLASILILGFLTGMLFGFITSNLLDDIFSHIKKRKEELILLRQEIIDGLCQRDKLFYQKKIREWDLKRCK